MSTVVVGLSGGMDSTTLAAQYLDKGYKVIGIHFQYGSKHNSYEKYAVWNIYEFYHFKNGAPLHLITVNLEEPFKFLNSALMLNGEEIPEGHYNDDNMRKTVVPGRNLILSSVMAGIAESMKAEIIALGVHAGDHHIYPDCRPSFINALHLAVSYSSDNKVKVEAPFLFNDKADILEIGYQLKIPVPYQLTRTCYKDQHDSCGKCGSCTERLEAFKKLGLVDPINYSL